MVNKIGKIDTAFRTFKMEVLAGESNTCVSLSENNCIYDFDYSQVYWNSRLHHEHGCLVKSFSPSDIVADMFCGVGPFSIPAAKKGCTVYANDLNPSCFFYLNRNVEKNHVQSNTLNHSQVTKRITTFNLDAAHFIELLLTSNIRITQIIMNLPASSEQFCIPLRDSLAVSPIHCVQTLEILTFVPHHSLLHV